MNPIKTIREALEILRGAVGHADTIAAADRGLAALAELEKQEPAHWRAILDPAQVPHQLKTSMHVVGFREKQAAEGFVAEQSDFYNWRYTIEPLYAAPVAQQPQAEAVPHAKEKRDVRLLDDPNATSNGQQRGMVGEVAVGQHVGAGANAAAGDPAAEGAVAVIQGVDEYGPLIGWYRHWSELQVGTKLFAAPQHAEAVPPGVVVDKGFRWDGEKQQHIPRLIIEFEPVPANSPYDAQGWRDRDQVAGMFAAAPKGQP